MKLYITPAELSRQSEWTLTFDRLLTLLQDGAPFAFTRWGDGEIECAMGCTGANRPQEQVYSPMLQNELQCILEEQNSNQTMFMGLQPSGDMQFPHFRKKYPNIIWSNADIIHEASMEGRFSELLSVLDSPVLFGPTRMTRIVQEDCYIKYSKIIPVSEQNAYDNPPDSFPSKSEIREETYLFCAGLASNVWIDAIWEYANTQHPTPNIQLIDLGSAYDPYCGIVSRKYHHDIVKRLGIPTDQIIYSGSQKNYKL